MFFFNANAQNLVPNPSFEEYWECPTGNDLNDGQLEKCKYWWKPTMGTSDYFNRCHIDGIVSVPNNFWGFQEPFQGDGYVGFVPNGWIKSNGESTGNEYLQSRLIKPLSPCTNYLYSMYISCANFSQYGFGKIGVLFTSDSTSFFNNQPISAQPQIIWNTMPIIDTSSWIKLEGQFIAKGNEKYITIGYFEENITNDTLFIQTFGTIDFAGYYYIDSLMLLKTNFLTDCDFELPNVFSPNEDGINDFFDFGLLAEFDNLDLSIVNRWGNEVYQFKKGILMWDGKNNLGQPCVDGIYYYILKINDLKKTGFIQLIRE